MSFARLKSEVLDLLGFVLLPACVALLPRKLGYRLAQFLADKNVLYRANEDVSINEMRRLGHLKLPLNQVRTVRRLTLFLDHADLYLSLLRTFRWRNRNVKVIGHWPKPDEGAVIFTFHWGAGFWALHHGRDHGLNAHMLVNDALREQFVGCAVRYAYIRKRIRRIHQILGNPTIDAQSNVRPVLTALKAGHQIIAVIDVPAPAGNGSEPVQLFGHTAHVPRALLRLAVGHQLPVYVYVSGINYTDGTRTVKIESLGTYADVATLSKHVFAILNQAVREEPAAWHLWSECHRFFKASQPEQAAETS